MIVATINEKYMDNPAERMQAWIEFTAWAEERGLIHSDGKPATKYVPKDTDPGNFFYAGGATYIIDKDQLVEIMLMPNVRVDVNGYSKRKLNENSHEENFKAFEEVQKAPATPEQSYNDRCNVHISGHNLSVYNETLLLEDSCTDALQNALDDGWRIIAACPQPDGRRPDYVLGRFNPTKDFALGAAYRASDVGIKNGNDC